MPPCRSAIAGSSEPAFTPMRIGQRRGPWLRVATSLMCSGLRMLPGFRRSACTPASDRGERELVLEVDVGDDRHRRARHDLRERRPRPPPRCTCSARCRRRPRRARRSARACRRRRRSWSWSSTAPTPARRRRPDPADHHLAGLDAEESCPQPTAGGGRPRDPSTKSSRACRQNGLATGWVMSRNSRRHEDEHQHRDHRHGDRHQLGRVDPDLRRVTSTRSARTIAIAMCPPSNGSSGTRLTARGRR